MAEDLKAGLELQATEEVSKSQMIQISDISPDDLRTDDSADEGFVLQKTYLFHSVATLIIFLFLVISSNCG
jgi:hypothetical protein